MTHWLLLAFQSVVGSVGTTKSSGASATVTTTAFPTPVLAASRDGEWHNLRLLNGSVAGTFSIDGGRTYNFIAANESLVLTGLTIRNTPILIKRIGSSDMAGVYAFAW